MLFGEKFRFTDFTIFTATLNQNLFLITRTKCLLSRIFNKIVSDTLSPYQKKISPACVIVICHSYGCLPEKVNHVDKR